MVAFFLGPVAIILHHRVPARTGRGAWQSPERILGVVSLIVAGMMTAAIGAAKAVDEHQCRAHGGIHHHHSRPATVSYWTGSGSSTEKVTADWKKSITSKDLNITSLSVIGDFSDATAAVSCEIVVDGKSAGKNVGNGAGANASCSGSTWSK
jgi:hypothetical protein